MGIPTMLLSILQSKKYKNVHNGVKNGEVKCDYFFLDYNGIIYGCYENVKGQFINKKLTKAEMEDIIIGEVVRQTVYLICDVVRPSKAVYISFDGPAPRAKMVQQRSRRYIGYSDKQFIEEKKKELGLPLGEWDRSANISPGTVFMQKLRDRLVSVIKGGGFNKHQKSMDVILSDSNIPGEGEHKFLPMIKEDIPSDAEVYLYGKDADLIILAISTHKNNVHIIREASVDSRDLKDVYADYEFMQLNIDNLRDGFYESISFSGEGDIDKNRILNDYIFLTFLCGNDFCLPLNYMRIKNKGMEKLITIYNTLQKQSASPDAMYLIGAEPELHINMPFFIRIIGELAKKEDDYMKEQYRRVNDARRGKRSHFTLEAEKDLSPFDLFMSRFTHTEMCSPYHPYYAKYKADFAKIDYNSSYSIWSRQYYSTFLGMDDNDATLKMNCVKNYMESLLFTLHYYFKGCPSWTWHYSFRVPPLMTDLHAMLQEGLFDIKSIRFTKGVPYTPFQQLMLILPPQMNELLPVPLRGIMVDDALLCTQYYPLEFKLDAAAGIKKITSEAILPEIEDEHILPIIKKIEKTLSKEDKERNVIRKKVLIYKGGGRPPRAIQK